MAIDTAAKRFRMLDFSIPTAPGMPPPDGTIDGDDRAAFLWLYLAGAAAIVLKRPISLTASLAAGSGGTTIRAGRATSTIGQ